MNEYNEYLKSIWHKASVFRPGNERTVFIRFKVRDIEVKCVGNYNDKEKCWRCGRGIKVEDFYCDYFYWADPDLPDSE